MTDTPTPLTKCDDLETLKSAADKLWTLLDDIDTACDMFKPSDEEGYRKFYEYTMRRVMERHAILASDGYNLFLPNNDSPSTLMYNRGQTMTFMFWLLVALLVVGFMLELLGDSKPHDPPADSPSSYEVNIPW